MAADKSPFDGSGVVPAVLDTGIDADHPAFVEVNLLIEDFTNSGPKDAVGHGTHCAGTIFGRDVDGFALGSPGVWTRERSSEKFWTIEGGARQRHSYKACSGRSITGPT